jgi:hypothetical protein
MHELHFVKNVTIRKLWNYRLFESGKNKACCTECISTLAN